MAGLYPDWMQPPPAMPQQGDPFMDYMRAQQPAPFDPFAPTGSYADTPAPGMMGTPGESIQPGPPLAPMAPRPGVAPEIDGPPPIPGQAARPSWMPPGPSGQRELGPTPAWLRSGQGKGAPAANANDPGVGVPGAPTMPRLPDAGTYPQRQRAITTAMQESKAREGQLEAKGQEAEAIARENAAKSRALADADDLKAYEAATAKAGRDRAQLDVEIKQLSEGKLDPQRFWNDAGTGAKIGMAVSAIIGGILAPNYGGRNTGVEMIEGIIKRDMAAQESDRSNKQWALGQRRVSIGENLGDAGDLASRQAQARAAAYGVAIDQANAMRSRMTSPAQIERANQVILGLEGGFVDSMANFEATQSKAELDRINAERDYKLQRSQVGQGWARISEDKRQFDAERADKAAERSAKAGAQGDQHVISTVKVPGPMVTRSVQLTPVMTRDGKEQLRDANGNLQFRGDNGKVVSSGDAGVRRETVRGKDGSIREIYTTDVQERTTSPLRGINEKDDEYLKTTIGPARVFDEAAGRLLRYDKGREVFSDADVGQAQSDASFMMLFAKDILKTGALDKGTLEVWEAAAGGDITAIRQMNTSAGRAKVENARRVMRRKMVLDAQVRSQQGDAVTEEAIYGSELPVTAPIPEVRMSRPERGPIERERGTR